MVEIILKYMEKGSSIKFMKFKGGVSIQNNGIVSIVVGKNVRKIIIGD